MRRSYNIFRKAMSTNSNLFKQPRPYQGIFSLLPVFFEIHSLANGIVFTMYKERETHPSPWFKYRSWLQKYGYLIIRWKDNTVFPLRFTTSGGGGVSRCGLVLSVHWCAHTQLICTCVSAELPCEGRKKQIPHGRCIC